MRQKIALDRIAEFGTIGGKTGDMLFDPESRLYHMQYDLEYDVRGNGDTIHKADRMKLNLFFDPFRRAAEQTELEVAVEMQRRSLQSILDSGGSVDDEEDKERIIRALRQADGNRKVAAELLGISRTTLYNKLEEYGLKYKFEQS